jgi:hypothetical protein
MALFIVLVPRNLAGGFGNRHVLYVGIDGLRPDALRAAETPHLKALVARGTVSWDGYSGGVIGTPTQQLTLSGPSWTSILTGVWTDKHRVIENSLLPYDAVHYPHFFRRILEYNPLAALVSIASPVPSGARPASAAPGSANNTDCSEGCECARIAGTSASGSRRGVSLASAADATVANARLAVEALRTPDLDVLCVFFSETDMAGHGYGFSPSSPQYLAAAAHVDVALGSILEALEARPTYSQEDWLIVSNCDHGGFAYSHGEQYPECRAIYMIVAGGAAVPGRTVSPGPGITAIPPTIATHLGVPIDPAWGWVESPFGLGPVSLDTAPVIQASPSSRWVPAGGDVTFGVLANGPELDYQWQFEGVPISGATGASLPLTVVTAAQAGKYQVRVRNAAGQQLSDAATLTILHPSPTVVIGQWDFEFGDLRATIGQPLEYFSPAVKTDVAFGSTSQFGIVGLEDQSVSVMRLLPSTASWGGLVRRHAAAPGGSHASVNQYTIICDLYYAPEASGKWRPLFQTNPANTDLPEASLTSSDTVQASYYALGLVTPKAWHRLILVVDLAEPPRFVNYVDGVKSGPLTLAQGWNGRWALGPVALLFASPSAPNVPVYLSSIQVRDGCISDAEAMALGGPRARKIGGGVHIARDGATLRVSRTGGEALEAADTLRGPWRVLADPPDPYVVPAGPGPQQFFRPHRH